MGDFIVIISQAEDRGDSFNYYSCKARFFLDFINRNNLLDLNFVGAEYTWCNE